MPSRLDMLFEDAYQGGCPWKVNDVLRDLRSGRVGIVLDVNYIYLMMRPSEGAGMHWTGAPGDFERVA
jgi:hypothetical protein